ncbi:MAG: MBOAT family protein [Lachnospiraceae bacterium]|jgi:D-alanyl-lipoteichoic acid acyltransferase DltB (MBOAT superfamily)|nr:MBOAT family protein [Lachnospiraceae bacterium]
MVYYKLVFAVIFLPATILFYQLFPKKYRWSMLLLASIAFYSTFSVKRIVFPMAAAGIAWLAGILLEKLGERQTAAVKAVRTTDPSGNPREKDEIKKEKGKIREACQRKTRIVLTAGILALLSILLFMKYTDFFLENINVILKETGSGRQFALKNFLLPLGISFYTLQAIGYLADVYWKKVPAQHNPFRLLLFLLFFPTIIEGPITPYAHIRETLFAGETVDPDQVMKGYIRLGWGAMKKLVIADRLFPAVNVMYDMSGDPHGAQVAAAAICFTIMEYMDFSGCIDMACGCAQMFGIGLPENFRQPFLAKNASEFWRRWHISLGVWFKTYIFYPVSMSGLARKWGKFAKGRYSAHLTKMVISAMALLPVWLCNGLWHGPKWTYIFYGVFYFVVIMAELILEPFGDKLLARMKLTKENRFVSAVRILKTWIIIFAGELFFRADYLKDGFQMFGAMFRDFSLVRLFTEDLPSWGLDGLDWLIVGVAFAVVILVNLMREKGKDILEELLNLPLILRFALVLTLALTILIFGLYGPGYEEVDMIYAGF